jgi:hypothetical protein
VTGAKSIHLARIPEIRRPPGRCAEAATEHRASDALWTPNGCLLAATLVGHGYLLRSDARTGKVHSLKSVNAHDDIFRWSGGNMWFFAVRNGLFVVAGSPSAGRVAAVFQDPQGSWVWDPLAELPAQPVGWAIDEGQLVLLTREDPPPSSPPMKPWYDVLRLTASRKLELLH